MKKSQRQLFVVKKCKISKELIPQVWIYFVTWKKRKSSLFVYQVNFKMSRFQMKIVTCDLKILIFFSWHLLHFTSLYLALASPTYDGDYHLQQILTYASLIICLNSGTSLSTTVIFNPPSCDPRSLIVNIETHNPRLQSWQSISRPGAEEGVRFFFTPSLARLARQL